MYILPVSEIAVNLWKTMTVMEIMTVLFLFFKLQWFIYYTHPWLSFCIIGQMTLWKLIHHII